MHKVTSRSGINSDRSLSNCDNDRRDVLTVLLTAFLLANDQRVASALLVTSTRQW